MTKLLTVFGATGLQGGSIIDYVLQHPELSKIYHLRGITRDVSKPAAIALKEKGVEVVKADMDEPSSLDEAVAGSYAVFAVTNFWEKASVSIEIAQGKAIADASVAAGASVLIWSSLPHMTKITDGRLTSAHHFDSKAEVEIYIRGLPIKSVFYMAGFYMQNFKTVFSPSIAADGTYEFPLPWSGSTRLPLIDVGDTGLFVAPALLDPDKYNGKRLTCATAYYSSGNLVDALSKAAGKEVKYVEGQSRLNTEVTPEVAKAAKEVRGHMSEWEYYGPSGPADLEWTLAQIGDKPTTWEAFVEANEPWFETK